jgi:hypothetical protein
MSSMNPNRRRKAVSSNAMERSAVFIVPFAPLELPRLQAGQRVRVELVFTVGLVVQVRNEEEQALGGVRLQLERYGWRGDIAIERRGVAARDPPRRAPSRVDCF